VQESEAEGDWTSVAVKFTLFAGKDMDGTEFAKLCRDSQLFCKKFKKEDVDSIFAKVVERGKRRINVEQFKTALRLIAKKKGCSVSKVQEMVAGSDGPVNTGTKAEANKFHDDPNLWTGTQAEGGHTTIDSGKTLFDQVRPNMH